jgi:hypothetical protein
MRMPRAVWLLAALVLATGARCEASVGGGLDVGQIESEIQTGIEEQNPGVTVSSVDCPDEVEAEEGNTFTCTANIEGQGPAEVTVTQTDDQGNVRWSVGEG